ncbi:MAG: hypothetical protein M3279_04190, partial [Actinomycetota bacterium]|nr:hypothetical protein [Actinomycetota bacterium]
LTVAGGHPVGNYAAGFTKLFLPGLDDGVVTMNSQCGNPNPVFPGILAPSGSIVANPLKAVDLNLPLRGVKNYLSHMDLQAPPPPGTGLGPLTPFKYLAAACTPWVTPTGMVMPASAGLAGTPWDARARYDNHYSFIQGSIDHSYDGGSDEKNPWPSASGQPATAPREYLTADPFGPNVEETRAITDSSVYELLPDGTHLVHPSFIDQMRVYVRGWPGKKIGKKRFWVWQRTYHLLGDLDDDIPDRQSSHYVYEFVGRR